MPPKPHLLPSLEALLVSLIWASSFVFVKMSLPELGPLTIGGLRYFLGFACLLPFLRRNPFSLTRAQWLRMGLLGLSAYTVGNGALFYALQYLPATTISFLMSLVTLFTLLGGMFWLKEIPTRLQAAGAAVALGGMALFFSPGLKPGEPLGLLAYAVALTGFVFFALAGRSLARLNSVDTLTLTALPLAIGGGLLLAFALPLEGIPSAPPTTWGLILWLAAVNTALGYILYNHALKTLTAFEMNVLLNLSPLWTALIGWLLLGESLVPLQWAGILAVMAGVLMVQKRRETATSQPIADESLIQRR